MDTVFFPYRSGTHLVLLYVIGESGSWEKHGLRVEYRKHITSSQAHDAVLKGEVEFVGGNHVSTYGHRARGDTWVYLGQTVNKLNQKLVVRPDSGIDGIADLRFRKVGTRGSHPSLNDWLYLKQRGLNADRDEVEIINQIRHRKGSMDPASLADPEGWTLPPVWQLVKNGEVDAAFLQPPSSVFAQQAGLKAIDIEPLPMIWFTTISSSLGFVEKNPELVERFLKGVIEGIHFFKTRPQETIKIIQDHYTLDGKMSLDQATATWRNLAPVLEPKLFPSLQAIANVYEEAVRQDKDALRINPMELWDLHQIRHLDDSGFVNALYKDSNTESSSRA
jgi:ABC-type nitrate/sulfonate/bicarbonate transport system substrate-binding protein